ncbi:hypothetical protein B0H67DRAFT_592012 [Lasiosphaeris hirsuta]|uniref:Early meiotic induction protein 1 n=1 Tax=Lasiosphaeris hirsuta TaxID=260670 RepID=A0AA40DIR2_9PEZI|nr:hypothetical protein B0H67DRAFT_592012 [Lasiosphaeris hirsuta]
MGWFWQQSSPSPTTPAANMPPPPTTPKEASASPAPVSGDREVDKFLSMLQTAAAPPPARRQPPPQPTPPLAAEDGDRTSLLSWARLRASAPQQPPPPPPQSRTPESLAMSEALLPTTMSCRDAFDYAWHCHTPGAQWNAVYRYGSVRSCSELWDDFWFCMRTKSFGPEHKAAAIREHYRDKERTKYAAGRPNSEDVWESRREMVPPGTAFSAGFPPPIENDAEWERADRERRRRIREELGIEGKKEGGQ